jgi:hypothetical protein
MAVALSREKLAEWIHPDASKRFSVIEPQWLAVWVCDIFKRASQPWGVRSA